MDQELETLRWDGDRRFGVEAEVNAFDGKSRPDDRSQPPEGIGEVANLMVQRMDQPVVVTKWMATHNNNRYVVKPDGSCGMEVCTPVLKGWHGLKQVCQMTEAFADDERIVSDDRCSLHVHVNVADCSKAEVGNIVAWWVKCEPVFLDSMPKRRKRSRYCQVVGMCDMFDVNEPMDPKTIIKKMGECKYFTLNNFHYAAEDPNKQRDTVEFRVAENDACTDPFYAKNWVRLCVHFVERAKKSKFPGRYVPGDPKTGLAWLDPIDVFEFLGFMPGQYDLSEGLKQTRNWFLARIMVNIFSGASLGGIWSMRGRTAAQSEVIEIIKQVEKADGFELGPEYLTPANMKESLYAEKYRV
jgi:hypothetical protein